jgi:hypothetical protein
MKFIEIKLEKLSYSPGETVSGSVRWQLEESVENIEIRLFYYTEGKGTSDVEIVESTTIPSPPLSGSHEFRWSLPQSPYSFSGTLISLVWAIEAVLLPSGDAEHHDFQMGPGGRELDIRNLQDESAR